MSDTDRERLLAIYHDPDASGLDRLRAVLELGDAIRDVHVELTDAEAVMVAQAEFVVLYMEALAGIIPLGKHARRVGAADVIKTLQERGWYAIRPDIRRAWYNREIN